MLKINNTLTRKKEEFNPVVSGQVKMYTCGVTVYDDCHIGHGRSLYVFEVMRRYLEYRGYKIKFVRNITDVDDKIINKARIMSGEKKISLIEAFNEVRTTYIDRYYQDLKLLDIPVADAEPLATENISDMIGFISKLIDKGIAYEVGGNVYFSVRKFSSYGKLSGKKIDDLFSSVRIENDPLKQDPLDFALWKASKEDEPYWESPWGRGRPGWHIECSVMSQKFLETETLDIHGGGRDLVFPHHENEVAQSEALTGKPFANYWIHHGLITINSQKMAKSLGNFVTIEDAVNKYGADILKIFFLGAHYSSPIDFSQEKMEEAKRAYERIDILMGKLNQIIVGAGGVRPVNRNEYSEIEKYKDKFIECMDDDFNMPRGLSILFDIVSVCNKLLESEDEFRNSKLMFALDLIKEITFIFGLSFLKEEEAGISNKEIEDKISLRLQYRKEKKYKEGDKIRAELEEKGIILEDTKDGTKWRRKL
jgi:cysteinyl-tRNA synthetase